MESTPHPRRSGLWDWATSGIVVAAAVVAYAWALPYAGSWSDGSRLAAIESIGARGTFIIDDSIFVKDRPASAIPLYAPLLVKGGIARADDRMMVRGHFYSHHPPVSLLVPGVLYRLWLVAGGPSAEERPDLFVFWITVATAGVPYVLAVWCVARLGRVIGLAGPTRTLLTLSFAAATVAPAYCRQVNGHIVLLAVGTAACLLLAGAEAAGRMTRGRALALGTVAGVGYCLDGVLGPTLALCVGVYAHALGGWRSAALVLLAAAPWALTHHAILFAISGDPLSPASNPANWQWEGSPFKVFSLTGIELKHSMDGFVDYCGRLLVGERGFLTHNLAFPLGLAAIVLLDRAGDRAQRRAARFACAWMVLGFGPYALLSDNLAGSSLSIRWFVPFLAPAYWLTGLLVQARPQFVSHLAWLTAGGLVLGCQMLLAGPWQSEPVPGLATIGWIAFIGWGILGVVTSPPASAEPGGGPDRATDRPQTTAPPTSQNR